MKKTTKIISSLMALIIGITSVNAAECNYEEKAKLNTEVAGIKAYNEVAIGQLDPNVYICEEDDCDLSYKYFKINILNANENYYVVISNNVDKNTTTLYYKDFKDGIATIDWKDVSKVYTLKFSVYSSNKTSCPGELIKVFYLTLPRYNKLSNRGECLDNKDSELCKEFTSNEKVLTVAEFKEQLAKENSGDNKKPNNNSTNESKILNFIKDNKYYFIAGTAVVIAGVVFITINRGKKSL